MTWDPRVPGAARPVRARGPAAGAGAATGADAAPWLCATRAGAPARLRPAPADPWAQAPPPPKGSSGRPPHRCGSRPPPSLSRLTPSRSTSRTTPARTSTGCGAFPSSVSSSVRCSQPRTSSCSSCCSSSPPPTAGDLDPDPVPWPLPWLGLPLDRRTVAPLDARLCLRLPDDGRLATVSLSGQMYSVSIRYDEGVRINRLWGIPIIGYFVRFIMLIPHFFVLGFLSIVVWSCCWWSGSQCSSFGARRTSSTPSSAATPLVPHVTTYMLMIVDPYPPFSLRKGRPTTLTEPIKDNDTLESSSARAF